MDDKTWKMIKKRFAQRPHVKASRVDEREFDEAMKPFGLNIDPDYRDFVIQFGGGIVGSEPIYGLRKAEWMGTIGGHGTAPEITHWFRLKNWPGIDDWLIFSMDKGGNPIGFAKDGTVWISDLTFGQIDQLAAGFEDFLLKWCLKIRPVTE